MVVIIVGVVVVTVFPIDPVVLILVLVLINSGLDCESCLVKLQSTNSSSNAVA